MFGGKTYDGKDVEWEVRAVMVGCMWGVRAMV